MEGKTIGIVGGGQLGRMLTDAAHKLGFKVIILDPTPSSPGGQVADEQIIGSFKDKDKVLELARRSDFLTFELESANAEALEEIEATGKPVNPSPGVLKIIKDKFGQKVFLSNKEIPVAPFALIENEDDIKEQAEIFGYPFLLKTRFDAYDGRGNYVIKNEEDIRVALDKFKEQQLYAEKFVPFEKELSVVSARDKFGTILSYPVVETIHKNNICHIVRFPADVSEKIVKDAESLANQVLSKLNGIGVFAIEMFLTKEGNVLVNEIAPRVHNSGHHTIEAFSASQFEEHIRAITDMPLIIPKALSKHAVMINILGERDGEAKYEVEDEVRSLEDVHIHVYGKKETKKERKMGHVTVLGDTKEEAERKAVRVRSLINI